MAFRTLTELYEDKSHFMITGHRGASWEFPENTLLSMEKAIEAGVDMIEFDVRGTQEGIPVILHDDTIDRTSNGHGQPEDLTLGELKELNFSYYIMGQRRETPVYDHVEIPTLEEIFQRFRDKAAMNIQVYAKSEDVLRKICRLYRDYEMTDRGYFTVPPEVSAQVKAIDPDIEFCTTPGWADRAKPEQLTFCRKVDGCRFVQPVREFVTAETFDTAHDLGLRTNVFFCDDEQILKDLKAMGADGILTNRAHLMCKANREG